MQFDWLFTKDVLIGIVLFVFLGLLIVEFVFQMFLRAVKVLSKSEPLPEPPPSRIVLSKRKARTGKTRSKLSTRKRFRILQRDGFRCQLCGYQAEEDGVNLEVDHRLPVSKGGSDDDDNLWTLCDRCNNGKSDTLVDDLVSDLDRAMNRESNTP